MTTVGESYHQHVVRHSHVGGGVEHDHMKMAVAACEGKGEVSAPKAFIEGLAPLAMMQYEAVRGTQEVRARTLRLSDDLVIVPEWIAAVRVGEQKYIEQVSVEPAWFVHATLAFGQMVTLGWFRYDEPRASFARLHGGPTADQAEALARNLAERVQAAIEAGEG